MEGRRKRGRDNGHEALEERPSKRRRLGQAAVLCMRELFRAVVKDGDIKEEDRLVLQNVAVLLSQVDGKTWVNVADTQGELAELTPQQLRTLRPFLEKVSHELKAHEMELQCKDADNGEHLDCLRLVDVPWADGITTRELLGCCAPDDALQVCGRYGWLEKATRVVPTTYMLRSRVRELINYYYFRNLAAPSATSTRGTTRPSWWRPSLMLRVCHALPETRLPGAHATGVCLRRCGTAGATLTGLLVAGARAATALLFAASASVAALVFTAAAVAVNGASALYAYVPASRGPLWPAMRFFLVAFLQKQVKRLFDFLVLIARCRVILCLASCNQLFGWLFYPFVFVAKRILGWNEGSWLLGCACEGGQRPSLLSLVPIRAADTMTWCVVEFARILPLPTAARDAVFQLVGLVHPLLSFLLDLLFSIGFAEGLALVVQRADERVQSKLVWMSMNVGRMLRERDPGSAPAALAPGIQIAAALSDCADGACGPAHRHGLSAMSGARQSSPGQLPAWSEGGDWSLFD
mmetsp:Transcript_81863/g.228074  ORF Transcript_81863/g.228074 Transcript_81863/m.228074 type:complete len:522 (-) Transcript_81863:114-1679(-)